MFSAKTDRCTFDEICVSSLLAVGAAMAIKGAKIYNDDAAAKPPSRFGRPLIWSCLAPDESGGLPSRFARAFINGLDLNETLGKRVDRMHRSANLSQERARFSRASRSQTLIASCFLKVSVGKGMSFQKRENSARLLPSSVTIRCTY